MKLFEFEKHFPNEQSCKAKAEYLQGYLNEFCYKFNGRYYGEGLFERLVDIGTCYQSEFVHQVYNKNKKAA